MMPKCLQEAKGGRKRKKKITKRKIKWVEQAVINADPVNSTINGDLDGKVEETCGVEQKVQAAGWPKSHFNT